MQLARLKRWSLHEKKTEVVANLAGTKVATLLLDGVQTIYRCSMERVATAKRYRHQAEELRAKADLLVDEAARAQYLTLAETYDGLAVNEERVASNLAGSPIDLSEPT